MRKHLDKRKYQLRYTESFLAFRIFLFFPWAASRSDLNADLLILQQYSIFKVINTVGHTRVRVLTVKPSEWSFKCSMDFFFFGAILVILFLFILE